jgi:pimeloyl-ACP methyl ester carboxylesterase
MTPGLATQHSLCMPRLFHTLVLHKRLIWSTVCAAALSLLAPIAASAAPPASLNCVRSAPSAEAAASAAPLLSELAYSCLPLASGRQVLVGQAGMGHAETVLLVHGLGNAAHRDWQASIALLARRLRVVTIDLPGFGDSSPLPGVYSFAALDAVLVQVLSQLHVEKVRVVGHSLGGAVSLHFAHKHPDKVERLVLVDTAGILLRQVYTRQLARLNARTVGIAQVDRILSDIDQRLGGMGQAVMSNMDGRFDFSRFLVNNPIVRNALFGRYTQIDAAFGLVEHDFSAAIRDTRAPTTLIWGRADPIAPLRTGELLAARMPDARLKVLDRVGHVPMEDAPDAFNVLLMQALTAPWSPRAALAPAPAPASGEARSVTCRNGADAFYTGNLDKVLIENCQRVHISKAQLNQLTLVNSTVTIDNSSIANLPGDGMGEGVALDARNSEVSATGLLLKGRIAIRAQGSQFDLAGTSLRASERAIEMPTASQLYFSVSDWESPEYSGDAHFAWPPGPGKN